MKKIKKVLMMAMLVLSLGVNSLIIASARENELDVFANNSVHKAVLASIYELEGKMVDINSIDQLYDLNELPNFLLITFTQGGYAIVTSSSFELSEYSFETDRQVPYVNTMIDSTLWIYGGPFNYLIKSIDDDYYDFYSGQILEFTPEKDLIDLSDNIIEGLLLKEGNWDATFSYTRNPTSWIGIPSSRFSRYTDSSWINNNSICGPHAAGNGYYRCNDNWGGSAVTIRTSWTIGIAYLNN